MNAAVLTAGGADAKYMELDHSGGLWRWKELKSGCIPANLRLRDGNFSMQRAIAAKPLLTRRRRGVKEAGNGGDGWDDGHAQEEFRSAGSRNGDRERSGSRLAIRITPAEPQCGQIRGGVGFSAGWESAGEAANAVGWLEQGPINARTFAIRSARLRFPSSP